MPKATGKAATSKKSAKSSSLAPPSIADGLRMLQDIGAQMASAAQSVATAGARATPHALAEPLSRYVERVMAVNAAITHPLARMLEEQQRLVQLMADWAEQHEQLSSQISAWAEQQRTLADHMAELAKPLLDQAAFLENLRKEWSASGDHP